MIDEEIRNNILNLYSPGKTLPYICKALKVSKATVSYQINKAGISRYRNSVKITEKILEDMQSRYDECKDLRIVSKEFGVSINRLKLLKRRPSQTNYEILRNRRYRIKQELVEYKGGKCQVCGYDRCLSALEFHHLDPARKDFTISSNMKYASLEDLKDETNKCILVCSNCHREIHAGIVNIEDISYKGKHGLES